MKHYFCYCIILFNNLCFAQSTFEKTLVPGNGNSVTLALDGGYVITGWQGAYVLLTKTDSSGNLLWSKTFGDAIGMTPVNQGYDVITLQDGGFLICGLYSPSTAINDAYFIRTDSIGDTLWTRHYPSPFLSSDRYHIYELKQTSTGEFIAAGQIEYNSSQPFDIAILKLDSAGNLIWQKEIDLGKKEIFTGLAITDSNYVIIGESYIVNSPIHDHFILRTDTSGNKTFSRLYSQSPCCDIINDLIIENDTNYVVVGDHNDTATSFIDFFRFGFNGDTLNYNSISNPLQFPIVGLIKNTIGFVLFGYKRTVLSDDAFLIRVDNFGNEIWRRIYGGNGNDDFADGQLTFDGNFVFTGWSSSFGSSTVYLVKTDTLGQVETNNNSYEHTDVPFVAQMLDDGQIKINCDHNLYGPFVLSVYNSLMQKLNSSDGYSINTKIMNGGVLFISAIDERNRKNYLLRFIVIH